MSGITEDTLTIARGEVLVGPPGAGVLRAVDVAVRGGVISALGPGLPRRGRRIDAAGAVVVPGLVNGHTHVGMRVFSDAIPSRRWNLTEWLGAVWKWEGHLTAADIAAGARLAIAEQLSRGVTCINDMYNPIDPVAHAVRDSGIRAVLARGVIDDPSFLPGAKPGVGHRVAEVLRVHRRFDRTAGGRIRIAVAPHSPGACTDGMLRACAGLDRQFDTIVHTHLNEDAATTRRARRTHPPGPVHRLDVTGLLGPRTVAAHCCAMNPAEQRLLAARGSGVVHCPVSNQTLGHPVAPVRRLLRAGVRVALGTDGPASDREQSLWNVARAAARRADLTPAQAFAMATEAGGRVLRTGAGILSVGARADLAVVEPVRGDLWRALERGPDPRVRAVLVDGRVVFDERLRTVPGLGSFRQLRLRVDQAARALRRRVAEGGGP